MLPVENPPPWKYRMAGRYSSSLAGMKIRKGTSASGPGAIVSTTEATSSDGTMKLPNVWISARPSSGDSVSNGGSPIDSTPCRNACACGCSGICSSPPSSIGQRSYTEAVPDAPVGGAPKDPAHRAVLPVPAPLGADHAHHLSGVVGRVAVGHPHGEEVRHGEVAVVGVVTAPVNGDAGRGAVNAVGQQVPVRVAGLDVTGRNEGDRVDRRRHIAVGDVDDRGIAHEDRGSGRVAVAVHIGDLVGEPGAAVVVGLGGEVH